jgi:MFS family permease
MFHWEAGGVAMSKYQLNKNLTLLYAFSFCWLAMVIIPVIVPFFASKGLSLADVFLLQSFFALTVVVFEVPSGYFADVIGRKNALVLGALFHGVGFTLLIFVDDFGGLMVFEFTLGIALSLLSGSDLSLFYDTQLALGLSPQEKVRGLARLRIVKSSAEGMASLLAAALALVSFDAIVLANALIGWMPFVLAFFLVEAPFERMAAESPVGNFRRILMHLFYESRLLRLTTLAVTFYGLSTFYVVWLIQPYWENNDIPYAAFGLLWAAMNFTIAAAARMAAPIEDQFGPVPILVVMAGLPVVGYFGMALDGGVLGMLVAFGFYISRGIHQVILTDAFNSRVPSEFRATANSLTGFLFRLTFIVTGPLVGWLYEWHGMSTTLIVLGIASSLLFLVLMLPLLAEIMRARDPVIDVA